jgi:hypothetical protein
VHETSCALACVRKASHQKRQRAFAARALVPRRENASIDRDANGIVLLRHWPLFYNPSRA